MSAFEGTYSTVHVPRQFQWLGHISHQHEPTMTRTGIYTVHRDGRAGNSDDIFKFITDGSNYEDVPSACGADDGYGGYNRSVSIGTEDYGFTTAWADCPATK